MQTAQRSLPALMPRYFWAVPATRPAFRVLVVGQTPPPFGGQAVMIDEFLKGRYRHLTLHHVRLAFSDSMESVGKFRMGKVRILFTTIARIWVARFKTGATVLYYPPSGPNKVPVLRDIVLLCATRWLFRRVIFHFHAGGVSGFRGELPALLRPWFDLAYRRPALAIRTAPQNPDDGAVFGALRSVVVPNGLRDMRASVQGTRTGKDRTLTILFTGVLIPSKGVRVLLQATRILRERGRDIRVELMGKWGDPVLKKELEAARSEPLLKDRWILLGEKRDEEKFRHFAACDIFCFPSFFEAESFGLVLVEAMMFAKPVVSTQWRGIPSVVEEGVNGWLVGIQDPGAIADRLDRLIADPAMRERMGREGRRIFEQRFTLERFHSNMEEAITDAIARSGT